MTNISDEMYENLQQILEKQNRRTYTFKDAKEIGDELVDFYDLLVEFGQEDNGQEELL